MAYKFESAKLLCTGGRTYNEDYGDFLLLPGHGCWVLADGLGGHGGGEVAARTAVEAALAAFARKPGLAPERLSEYMAEANRAVLERQKADPRLANMRTTLTLMVSDYQSVAWAHIGDTRLYYARQGQIENNLPLTKDHSVPQALVNAGELKYADIRFHEDRNRLLRALGSETDFRPAVSEHILAPRPGDAFLLCTDGFWEYVDENRMSLDLCQAAGPQQWLAGMKQRLESQLTEQAITDNDNYSAIAVVIR